MVFPFILQSWCQKMSMFQPIDFTHNCRRETETSCIHFHALTIFIAAEARLPYTDTDGVTIASDTHLRRLHKHNCTKYITHILCCFSCTNSTQDVVVAGAIQWSIYAFCLLHSALCSLAFCFSRDLQEAARRDSRGDARGHQGRR
jgi:hypothetical protein